MLNAIQAHFSFIFCCCNVIHLRWYRCYTQAYSWMCDWISCIQQHTSEFISINLIETVALAYTRQPLNIYHLWLLKLFGSIALDCQRHRSERHTRTHKHIRNRFEINEPYKTRPFLAKISLHQSTNGFNSQSKQFNSIDRNESNRNQACKQEKEDEKSSRLSEIYWFQSVWLVHMCQKKV